MAKTLIEPWVDYSVVREYQYLGHDIKVVVSMFGAFAAIGSYQGKYQRCFGFYEFQWQAEDELEAALDAKFESFC